MSLHRLYRMIVRLVIFGLPFYLATAVLAQLSPTSSFKLYNTNHGLPSTQIQGLFEDSHHFIWAITDRGIARFDGYQFKVYTTKDGLPSNNVLLINEDRRGRIWFMCNTGEYCYLENDSIRTYNGNKQIKSKLRDRLPGPFYFDTGDTLWVTTFSGIQLFKCVGDSVQEYEPPSPRAEDGATYYLRRVGEKLLTLQIGETRTTDLVSTDDQINYLLTLAGECKLACSVKVDEKKWAVAGPGGYVVFDEQGSIITHYSTSPYIFSTLEHDRMGRLWLTNSNGAYLLDNYSDGPERSTVFFEGHFISSMLQDRQGNYWFGDRDNGIFFVPDLDVKVIREPMVGKQNKIVSIKAHRGEIFYSDAGGKIYRYHENGAEIIQGKTVPSGVSLDFSPLPNGEFIVGNKPQRVMANGVFAESIVTGSTVRKSTLLLDGTVMLALSDGIAEYKNKVWKKLHESAFKERSNSVYERSNGEIWIGTNNGVFVLEKDSMRPLLPLVKNKVRVVDMVEWNNQMLFATRQQGLACLNGEELRFVTEEEGLLSNTIDCLLIDPQGDVWIGTSLGLQCLHWNPELSTFQALRTINTDKGLPSNEINAVFIFGESMLVATNDGMAVIQRPWLSKQSAAPIVGISSVKVGEMEYPFHQPLTLRYDQNQIRFSFLSYNFRMGTHSLYRYRLLGLHDDWIVTSNTSAEYWSIQPNAYQFEVQSINEDGQWSSTETVYLEIRPHFAQTWWFRLMALVLVALLSFVSIRWWHKAKQKELLQRAKVAELKQQALNANMNPHFIFNALNSIQHLVLKNKTLEANEYLTDFSKLIRMNLEANAEQVIVLDEELERLELYLKLEQLRFADQLTYSIKNSSGLYLGALEIPPMFLQPFVENAIVHGVLPSGKPGHIQIDITDAGKSYQIEILDNGIGLRAAAMNQRPGHTSLATKINTERLEILQNMTGQPCELKIVEVIDRNDNSLGTKVLVVLPKQILP